MKQCNVLCQSWMWPWWAINLHFCQQAGRSTKCHQSAAKKKKEMNILMHSSIQSRKYNIWLTVLCILKQDQHICWFLFSFLCKSWMGTNQCKKAFFIVFVKNSWFLLVDWVLEYFFLCILLENLLYIEGSLGIKVQYKVEIYVNCAFLWDTYMRYISYMRLEVNSESFVISINLKRLWCCSQYSEFR